MRVCILCWCWWTQGRCLQGERGRRVGDVTSYITLLIGGCLHPGEQVTSERCHFWTHYILSV